jgi:hypothetical protein
MQVGVARCPQDCFAGSTGMMKKMTYETTVTTRNIATAHAIRRARYLNTSCRHTTPARR